MSQNAYILTSGQSGATDLTVPISYCAICDAGKAALDVPNELCGHSPDQRRVFHVRVVPLDPDVRLPAKEA